MHTYLSSRLIYSYTPLEQLKHAYSQKMPFTVDSYAVNSATSDLEPYKLERRDLCDDDIHIDIMYSGICHTDQHFARDKWGNAVYPMVPGHEIVGLVSAVGKNVKKYSVGDFVAVGCIVDSCRKCTHCLNNEEMFCTEGNTQAYNSPEPRFPGHSTAGGYSEAIVVPEHFVLKVPKSLQTHTLLPGVAPILCAGVTMYCPLKEFEVSKGQKIGIIGLGGLGLMGVRLAVAMGAEVMVISRNHNKDSDAKAMGAKGVISSSSKEELALHDSTFDLLIDTIPTDHDINIYFPLLKPHKTLAIVGHVGRFEKNIIDLSALILGNRHIAGSFIGGIEISQEVLNFCGEHEIVADHTIIPMEQANEAWKVISDSAKRYIIDISAFSNRSKSN